jgi:hypothetical protein
MKTKSLILFCSLALQITFTACSSDQNDEGEIKPVVKTEVSGNIEKGPFVQGSKVTLYELDANLSQTGKTFRTQTNNDLGAFTFDTPMQLNSQYVELETSGYFYNEVRGYLSNSQITLNAISNVDNRNSVNVNLITHLEYGRVKKLVRDGMNFTNAKKQAEKELLACFAITDEISIPEGVSITDNSQNSAILLAISTIMLYNHDIHSEAEFTEFISKFSSDFADNGQIDNSNILEKIKKGQKVAHPSDVIKHLKEFYAKRDIDIKCDDFSRFIDFDGNGVIDNNDKEETYDVPHAGNIWEDKNKLHATLNSGYMYAQKFNSAQQQLEYIRTGKVAEDAPWWYSSLSSIQITSRCPIVDSTFTNAYNAIHVMNLLINQKEEIKPTTIDLDSKKQNTILGQAIALRAFIYYNIAMLRGNVPLDTQNIDHPCTPSNQSDVYNFALSEVEKAINLLPSKYENAQETKILFTKDAALMLKAEILLTLGNKSGAANVLSQIEDSNYNSAIENTAAIYSNYASAKPLIFAFHVENSSQPIYTYNHYKLLTMEAQNNTKDLANEWKKLPCTEYGYWAALKRNGIAQSITGCKDYELLMPIPERELECNPYLRPNPGY